jgi:hypothetical protein
VAAWLRFYHLGSQSMWHDELWSLEWSTGRGPAMMHQPTNVILPPPRLVDLSTAPPFWAIWSSMDEDTQPPLYYILLRWWRDIFGSSDVAVRSLSVLASLLAILVLYDVCRILHGPSAALWACLIMALAVPQIQIAQTTRGYSILILLLLVVADALARIQTLGASAPRLAVAAVCAVAAALIHYFSAGILVGMAIYGLWRFGGSARRRAIGAGAAAVLFLAIVWGVFLWRQMTEFARPFGWGFEPSDGHVARALARLLGMPSRLLLDKPDKLPLRPEDLPLLIALLLLVLVVPLIRRGNWMLWWLWLVGGIGLLAFLDLRQSSKLLTFSRYTSLSGPAAIVLVATLLNVGRGWRQFIAPAVVLLAVGIYTADYFQTGPDDQGDWRSYAQIVDRFAGPNDLLVFDGNIGPASGGLWYIGFEHYAPNSHRPVMILGDPNDPAIARQIKPYAKVWLIRPPDGKDFPALKDGRSEIMFRQIPAVGTASCWKITTDSP